MLIGVVENLLPVRNEEFCFGMGDPYEPDFPRSDRLGEY